MRGEKEKQEFREAQEVTQDLKCRRTRKFWSRARGTQIKHGGGAREMGLVPPVQHPRENPSRIQGREEPRSWGAFTG